MNDNNLYGAMVSKLVINWTCGGFFWGKGVGCKGDQICVGQFIPIIGVK